MLSCKSSVGMLWSVCGSRFWKLVKKSKQTISQNYKNTATKNGKDQPTILWKEKSLRMVTLVAGLDLPRQMADQMWIFWGIPTCWELQNVGQSEAVWSLMSNSFYGRILRTSNLRLVWLCKPAGVCSHRGRWLIEGLVEHSLTTAEAILTNGVLLCKPEGARKTDLLGMFPGINLSSKLGVWRSSSVHWRCWWLSCTMLGSAVISTKRQLRIVGQHPQGSQQWPKCALQITCFQALQIIQITIKTVDSEKPLERYACRLCDFSVSNHKEFLEHLVIEFQKTLRRLSW